MKRYLLDTCVISEQARRQPSDRVQSWLDRQPPERLHLSVISIAEIRQGIHRLDSDERARAYAEWLDGHVIPAFAGRVLPVDLAVAECWGAMRGAGMRDGRPLTLVDSLIGATALVHDMGVATRNVKDFSRFGVRLLNPWEMA